MNESTRSKQPRIGPRDAGSGLVHVIVDTPKGSDNIITRLIAGFRAKQREGRRMLRNDRLIAVPDTAVNIASIRSIDALPVTVLGDIEHFFRS